jgi:putative toxin-antitoxin system antitoxin component (TIGR02293 family)
VDEIARMFDISQSQASLLIGVSIRTVQARKKETPLKTLHLQESDSALQITKLRNDALEYFGSEQAVNRWMKSVNKGLGDKAPITLCNTGVGRELVRESLNRLKYGMTA